MANDLPYPTSAEVFTAQDRRFMDEALRWAQWAAVQGEVPVAALVVAKDKIIGIGYNIRENNHDPGGHAELVALREACRRVARWRLDGATIYVTLEPCPMCAGAIVNARIRRLVYATDDPKSGAVRSLYRICDDPRLNHRVQVQCGLRSEASQELLKRFFSDKRKNSVTVARTSPSKKKNFLRGIDST